MEALDALFADLAPVLRHAERRDAVRAVRAGRVVGEVLHESRADSVTGGVNANLLPSHTPTASEPWYCGVSLTPGQTDANGGTDGVRIQGAIQGIWAAYYNVASGVAVTAGQAYCFSFYAKLGSGNTGVLFTNWAEVPSDNQHDLLVGYEASLNTSTFTRVYATLTPPTGCAGAMLSYLSDPGGGGTADVYISHVKFETGAVPTGTPSNLG